MIIFRLFPFLTKPAAALSLEWMGIRPLSAICTAVEKNMSIKIVRHFVVNRGGSLPIHAQQR